MSRGRRKCSASLARGDSPWDWKGLNLKEKVWDTFWSLWRGHPEVAELPNSFLWIWWQARDSHHDRSA